MALGEGAALAAAGAPKYVIRTDLLFYKEAAPAFDKARSPHLAGPPGGGVSQSRGGGKQ